MEDWKKAYKEIHGRTPTKKDVSLAPKALRGDSPTKVIRRSPRKSSTLKRPADSSFISPIKKRRILDSSSTNILPTSTSKLSVIEKIGNDTLLSEKEKIKCAEAAAITPSKTLSINESINLLSPCKNWAPLMRRNVSPKKTPQKKPLMFDPKTPSPMKPLGKSITCRNIKHLMDVRTPEKNAKEEEELFEEFADEKPENAKPYKPPTERKKKDSDKNFVKVNLRKRNYVKGKPSKFNKKKWLKYKKRT